MATLQEQYNLIKEGKGDKQHFLKQAKYLFPEYVTSLNDFDTTVHILKSKSLLSEAAGGVVTLTPATPNWFKTFNDSLKEAVGVKNKKEYGDQNEFEKIDKDVQKTLDHQFDNKNNKNVDNVYGQSFLMGYYTEMKDPKNANKTVDELKQIVLKNMTKDVNYYHTKASFGVKDIGYTNDVVGGGEPKEPKGKYKSSGYGDMPKPVKESIYRKSLLELLSEDDIEENEDTIEEGPLDQQIAAAEKKVEDLGKQKAAAELALANIKKQAADKESAI